MEQSEGVFQMEKVGASCCRHGVDTGLRCIECKMKIIRDYLDPLSCSFVPHLYERAMLENDLKLLTEMYSKGKRTF